MFRNREVIRLLPITLFIIGCLAIGPEVSAHTLWQEKAKLTASDAGAGDQFGQAVAIAGAYTVAGAPYDNSVTGSAYAFKRSSPTSWPEEDKLTASDGAGADAFGCSVTCEPDYQYAIVGAYCHNATGASSGAVYVFNRESATSWAQTAELVGSDTAANDHFGCSVSLDQYMLTVVAGALHDDNAKGTNAGAAYVFAYAAPDTWPQQRKLTASDGEASDYFGCSVAISPDTSYLIVGAYGEDTKGTNAGAAYIFSQGGPWNQVAKLTASDGANGDGFGRSVSIDGDYAIVGASGNDDANESSGSAYIFKREGSTWNQIAKLTASDAAEYDYFGEAVSISGEFVIIGAYGNDDAGESSGSAYVFKRGCPESNWIEHTKLTASDAAEGDRFGYSVEIDGDYAIVGAYYDDDDGNASGSAYIFKNDLCPTADITGDCFVDLEDLGAMGQQWLQGGV